MRSLSEKYDREIDEAVAIYGGRKTMNIRAFREEFDHGFWRDVIEWAAQNTEYRKKGKLLPADPEFDWECRYCYYRHRCGQMDEPYTNMGSDGFELGDSRRTAGRYRNPAVAWRSCALAG